MPIQWDFHHSAKAIIAAQTQYDSNNTTIHDTKIHLNVARGVNYESSSLRELNHWVIEHANPVLGSVGIKQQQLEDHPDDANSDYSIYLSHPPIILLASPPERLNSYSTFVNEESLPPLHRDKNETEIQDRGHQRKQLDDDSEGGDYNHYGDDILCEDSLLSTSTAIETTITTTTTSLEYYTEWSFSILMHTTWRVPTLYFSCCHSDGTPLCRREVLDMLLQPRGLTKDDSYNTSQQIGDDGNEDDELSWEFVSQEEHPMTGQPSYFLHPCRTAERMELMMSYHYCNNQSGQLIQERKGEEKKEEFEDDHRIIPLLSWMSMVLPVVGCKISPEVFCRTRCSLSPPKTKS